MVKGCDVLIELTPTEDWKGSVRKVHEVNGVSIYESEYEFDGFYINPSDAKRTDSGTLEEIDEWCRKRHRAHYAADIFAHLAYHFDSQFMELQDLDLISEAFADTHIGNMATAEKNRILRGESRKSAKKVSKQRVTGYVYLVAGEGGVYKIGKTTQLDKRVNFFEIKLPFPIELVCVIPSDDISGLERQMHKRFADKHVNGEWFKLTQQEVEEIKSMASSSST
jgi:hypothetical protein